MATGVTTRLATGVVGVGAERKNSGDVGPLPTWYGTCFGGRQDVAARGAPVDADFVFSPYLEMHAQQICADDVRGDHLSLMMSARSVVSNASRSMRAVGTTCPKEDLEAFGLRGLWEAAVRFDPHRGVPFAAYATSRVRGAIVDGLRSDGSLPRRRGEGKESGMSRFALPVDVEELRPEEPDWLLERAEILRLVEEALEQMPRERAEVIRRHFLQGEALSDIARERGRSRSWGSRQLELALASLRRQVREAA